MLITPCYSLLQALVILILGVCLSPAIQAQTASNFEGFFADVGFGYRDVNISTSSTLIVNGRTVPSTLSTGQPSNFVTAFKAGYSIPVTVGYTLGIGANISPASGEAQQVQVQALNQNISLAGIKPLYSYGFFLTPGVVIEDGLAYLKAGTQTQVNNSNTSPNFYGYLLSLGYKKLIYQSVYLFGEAEYAVYDAQTIIKTVNASGRTINASVTTKPQGARYLIGFGYQF